MNPADLQIHFHLTNRDEIQKFLKGAITRIQANRLHQIVNGLIWLKHWQPCGLDGIVLRVVEGYPKIKTTSMALLINIVDRFEVILMSSLEDDDLALQSPTYQERKGGIWYQRLTHKEGQRIKPVVFSQSINIEIFDPITKREFLLHV